MKSLKRALGLYATTALVIGSVVGSGIFSSPSQMARDLPSAPYLMGVWVLAGVLTLFGAFTQCELVGQMPKTGGLYEYFREVYGEGLGFLYGWANLMIAGSGAIAAISFFFAQYFENFIALPHFTHALTSLGLSETTPWNIPLLGAIYPYQFLGRKIVAAGLVVFLTALNVRGVKLGGTLQSISTTAKLLAILAIVVVAFMAGGHVGSTSHWSSATSTLSGWTLFGAVALAMSGAFWSYDGWGNAAYIADEVREPKRTIPKAIILGTLTFITVYFVVNLAYFYILSVEGVANAPGDRVASQMMFAVVGASGAGVIALLMMLSAFDTTNSSVLTNARVYYAMARNQLFYRPAATVHPKFQTPHVALILQGVWSIVLLVTGSFDLITSMYVFVNWVLYVLMAVAVFVLRARSAKMAEPRDRPFSVPGYPYVPAIFILFASAYVIITLVSDIQAYNAGTQPLIHSVTGLVLVLTGLPFYFFWRTKRRALNSERDSRSGS
ncbi:MAG: amino acid permease [Bacteroidota bacterium]|nr:amino acid permease [Bacteroidota bacterium]MDP4234653.1 amino acid permease [Bacteroidota bacterium]MDP4243818.1 amino acid permease [Bacteroidota bacterium]MDP4288591.1 amino acid permease [Bacteroidota bacterium]